VYLLTYRFISTSVYYQARTNKQIKHKTVQVHKNTLNRQKKRYNNNNNNNNNNNSSNSTLTLKHLLFWRFT